MGKTFVFIDVSKKQEFIFKSNKLKDNLKNSYIIKSITEYDESQVCDEKELNLNAFISKYRAVKEFCGGGNSIISFDSEEVAKEFIREYSRRVLKVYPDLELYLSKLVKEDNSEFCKKDRDELLEIVNKLKEKRKSRYEKISFGVEKLDRETGFPVEIEREGSKYEIEYKNVERARENLSSILDLSKKTSMRITPELQDYKSKEQMNYIGIISIDGNGMAELVEEIQDIKTLSKISTEIRNIYFDAASDYLKELDKFTNIDIKKCVTPIVSAGDDLCLILDGKIAIDASAKIIEKIKEKSIQSKEIVKIRKQGLTACAGIAIVKAGYPFFDAYKEAEKMCKNAKKYLHRIKNEKKYSSIIDWKIIQGSNIEANDFIENIKIENEKYHIKPLIVDEHKSYYDTAKDIYVFSYEDFKNISKRINEEIDKEEISKSILKKLQESFYKGFESYEIDVKAIREEYTKPLFHITDGYFNSENDENIENKLGVIKESSEGNVYVLNDIIDSLKFLTTIDSN